MFDFYDMDRRQMTRLILLGIILITLPCYCLGAILLASAPRDPVRRASPTNPTLGGATALPSQTYTFTPFFSMTPFQGGLSPTPGQFNVPRTATPFVWPTAFPTAFPTAIPTLIQWPTLTLAPTLTPTMTLAPTLTPSQTPTPTLTPTPTDTPTDTPTVFVQPPDETPPTQEVIGG